MRDTSVGEMAAAVEGTIIYGHPDTEVSRISLDSRTLEPGDLFIPLRGETFDGHDFIEQAVERGAKAVMVDRDGKYCYQGVAVIRVRDTLEAFHNLARWYRNKFETDFVAVTGSTGKTTTKNIIASVLGKKYSVLKTPGNYNNEIGLPFTIMELNESYGVAVTEMGMSSFGEIRNLMTIVRPRISVVTNIGMSHIEMLGSREGILRAKMEIFEGMASNPAAVINADDPLLLEASKELSIPVVYYGTGSGHYIARNISVRGDKGVSYTLIAQGSQYEVELPLPGRHNVYNSLAAIAVGRLFDIGFEEIIQALKELEGEKMRLDIITTNAGVKIINDAYNASPDSMKSALEVLSHIPGGRKIAVLSDMLEMGMFAEEGHRIVGQYAAQVKPDILVTVGQDSRFIALEARKRGMEKHSVYYFQAKQDAAELLDRIIKKDDVILLKGSRGMKMEELVNRILERS